MKFRSLFSWHTPADHTSTVSSIRSVREIAEKHPDVFIAEEVFPNLFVDEFRFPSKPRGDKPTSNMISQYVQFPSKTTRGGTGDANEGKNLALHLNCVVKASTLQNDAITLRVELFHITCRSLETQKLINAHGPSKITADNSIHMGINTRWVSRANNLEELAKEVSIDQKEDLIYEVERKQGYSHVYVESLVKEFKGKVSLRIHQLLNGNVTVRWTGDKSFPTA